MDFSSLMPLLGMMNKPQASAPIQQATPVSEADREYIKQNTSIYPSNFVSNPYFNSVKQDPARQEPIPQAPIENSPAPSGFNISSLMPLLGGLGGGGGGDMMSKLMGGMGGGGSGDMISKLMGGAKGAGGSDMSGLLGMLSGLGGGNKNSVPTKKKRIFESNSNIRRFTRT